MFYFVRLSAKFLLLPAITFLVISIINPPASFGENRYVGSAACGGCHPGEYNNFMKYAKKSKSFESIERVKKSLTEEELKGCYSCHTTGYGKKGGFESLEKTSHLKDAGCEVCHGPGGTHVKSMSRRDIKTRMKIEDCEGCHTSERISAF
ncbi:MAG: cytochrome C, partial [Nitrospirae bacterium]|nr:cytochrome C [Nitrospirota bacterium]